MSLAAPQRRVAYSALILATVIAVLDISAVNLALPSIASSLGVGINQALWLSKANLLTCAITILPCAALGDVIGHRRLLSFGLVTFATTSASTAMGNDLGLLIGLRAVQGVASAAIMCSTLVLIREIYPARMLGSALGINASFVAVATTAGPVICGLILTWFSWRWVFAITPFLALIALTIGRLRLPEKRSSSQRFDLIGTVILMISATLIVAWHACPIAGSVGVAACVTLLLFVLHQHHATCPILPLKVFRNVRFDYALASSVIAFIGQSSVFIALPLVLQRDMGHSPLMAAALFLPWPVATAIAGPWAGRASDRSSARTVASTGIALFLLGLTALAQLPLDAAPLDIAWRTALCGVGFGLFQSPNNREILTNISAENTAHGAALLCTARLIGQALGAACVPMAIAPILSDGGWAKGAGIGEMIWSIVWLQLSALLLGSLLWGAGRLRIAR